MPESDPDNGEINDVEEFMREFDNIERDETLIGLVGEGYDVNAPGDQAVADLLGAWRDDIGREPVAWPAFPSAHITGGNVSIQENAQQVMGMADDQAAQGMLSQCDQALDNAAGAIASVADDARQRAAQAAQLLGGQDGETVNGQGQQVAAELETLLGLIQAARTQLDACTGYANALNTAMRDAAQRHLS